MTELSTISKDELRKRPHIVIRRLREGQYIMEYFILSDTRAPVYHAQHNMLGVTGSYLRETYTEPKRYSVIFPELDFTEYFYSSDTMKFIDNDYSLMHTTIEKDYYKNFHSFSRTFVLYATNRITELALEALE